MKLQKFKRVFAITILMIMLLVSVLSVSTEAAGNVSGAVGIRPAFANVLSAIFSPLESIKDMLKDMIRPIMYLPINRMQSSLLEDSDLAKYLEYGSSSGQDAAQNRMQKWFDIFELAGLAFLPLIVLRAAILLIGSFTSPSDRGEVKEFIKNTILYIAILLFAKDVILWLVNINDAIVALFRQASQQAIHPPTLGFDTLSFIGLLAYLLVLVGTYLLSIYIWVLMFVRKIVIGLAYALIPIAAIMIFSTKFRNVFKTLYDEVMSAVFQQAVYAGTYVILYDMLVYILSMANGNLSNVSNGIDTWNGWFTKTVPVVYASGQSGSLAVLGPLGWLILMFLLLKIAKKMVSIFGVKSANLPDTGEIIKEGAQGALGIAGVVGAGAMAQAGVMGTLANVATKGRLGKFAEGVTGGIAKEFGDTKIGKAGKFLNEEVKGWHKKGFKDRLLEGTKRGLKFAHNKGAFLYMGHMTGMQGVGAAVGIGSLGAALFGKEEKKSPMDEWAENELKRQKAEDEKNAQNGGTNLGAAIGRGANTNVDSDRLAEDKTKELPKYEDSFALINDKQMEEMGMLNENGQPVKFKYNGNDKNRVFAKKITDAEGKEGHEFYKMNLLNGKFEKVENPDEIATLSGEVGSWKEYGGAGSYYGLGQDNSGQGYYAVKSTDFKQQSIQAINARFNPTEAASKMDMSELKNVSHDLGTAVAQVEGTGMVHLNGNVAMVTQLDVKSGEQKVIKSVTLSNAEMQNLNEYVKIDAKNGMQTAVIETQIATENQGGTVNFVSGFTDSNHFEVMGATDAILNADDKQLRQRRVALRKSIEVINVEVEQLKAESAEIQKMPESIEKTERVQEVERRIKDTTFLIESETAQISGINQILASRNDISSMLSNQGMENMSIAGVNLDSERAGSESEVDRARQEVLSISQQLAAAKAEEKMFNKLNEKGKEKAKHEEVEELEAYLKIALENYNDICTKAFKK